MAVIDDFYIGKTRIIVTDDYFCKDEDIPVIIDRISKNASRAFQAEAYRKALEDKTA